mmetsp:Transcript_26148/g.102508  ORF Transcript_26148/g.102508 Transcript_26148/m.102508 type:complete len:158 (-) Transcript_26148:431-904(-)
MNHAKKTVVNDSHISPAFASWFPKMFSGVSGSPNASVLRPPGEHDREEQRNMTKTIGTTPFHHFWGVSSSGIMAASSFCPSIFASSRTNLCSLVHGESFSNKHWSKFAFGDNHEELEEQHHDRCLRRRDSQNAVHHGEDREGPSFPAPLQDQVWPVQ